jgi:hypothetical protein
VTDSAREHSSPPPGIVGNAARLSWRDPVFTLLSVAGAVVVIWQLYELLAATGGRLIYTLDDGYISLALSEGIARGHYGINAGELCSPSSSVLYPFLLAPAAGTRFHVAMPLILNVAGAAVTLWALSRIIDLSAVASSRAETLLIAALAFVGTFLNNLYGVIFVGLEHSFHVAASVVILAGLIATIERGRTPIWLLAAIVLSPLIRFEGIVASLAALLVLFALGARRQALVSGTVMAACLAAYFLAMHALDLPILPASVTAKSRIARAASLGNAAGAISALREHFAMVPKILTARFLVLTAGLAMLRPLVAGLIAPRSFQIRHALIPIFVAAVTLGHTLGGSFNWFERYDVYALAVGSAGLLYIYRLEWRWIIAAMAQPASRPVAFLFAATAAGVVFVTMAKYDRDHWAATLQTAAGAYNIYEQQAQMSRFVREFYRAPVAVNDLGYVAWRNPYYVLDTIGLGSEEVRRLRRAGASRVDILKELIPRHKVGLAMVYERSSTKSLNWEHVAYLRLGTPRVTPAGTTVTFFRTPEGSKEKILQALHRFKATLPAGVVLDFWPQCGARTKLAALNTELPDGSPLNASGITHFRCPLTVEFDKPRIVSRIRIQANFDDEYRLRLMNRGKEVAYLTADRSAPFGLRTRVVDTRPVLADSIILDGYGDNRYSVSRLEVIDAPN